MSSTAELDHLNYVRDRPYRRASHLAIRRLTQGPGLSRLTVIHEPNGECCQLEPWSLTFPRMIAALNADGLNTAGVSLAEAPTA